MSLYAVKNDNGEWLGYEIYCDEPDWFDHGGFIWDTRSIAEENVKLYGGHVAELFDAPAKVVVSEEEAEMLEQAKCDDDPAELIVGFVNSHDNYDDDREAEDRLMRAYVIGWTVEKPKRWNVKVPHTKDVWYYKSWNSDLRTISDKELCSKFTESEIEHYGLQDCEKEEVTDDGTK
ncbi:DUF1642 domain-containing protein [Lacticaseibacillus sp. N501-2]|uniref:DUF1642 domain-containing protein n=1 Tax=Lacticaseibacillus salsurae TaxID=3367729 RepID=UPI0038B327FE